MQSNVLTFHLVVSMMTMMKPCESLNVYMREGEREEGGRGREGEMREGGREGGRERGEGDGVLYDNCVFL